jgi:hypothetical protein
MRWTQYIDDPDTIFISCNSAIEKVQCGYLIQFDLGPKFGFSYDVTLIAPKSVVESYGRGIWYTWDDIPKLCSAFTALYIADRMTNLIIMVGFDNLKEETNPECDHTYHSDFPQGHETAQWQWGLEQQIPLYKTLPSSITDKVIIL